MAECFIRLHLFIYCSQNPFSSFIHKGTICLFFYLYFFSLSAKKFQPKLFNSCWTNIGKIQNNLPLENTEKEKCKTEQIILIEKSINWQTMIRLQEDSFNTLVW